MKVSDNFCFGAQMVYMAHGLSNNDFLEKKAYVDTLQSSPEVSRMLCKLAAALYQEAGKTELFQFHMYDMLSKQADWDPAYDDMVEPVIDALATVLPVLEEEQMQRKAASLPILSGLIGRGAGMTPGVVKQLTALGVLGGAGAGALSWYANKDIHEDDKDLEAMSARIRNYDQITQEISDRLRAKGGLSVDEDTGRAIEQATD
jgi:hypothetical protein